MFILLEQEGAMDDFQRYFKLNLSRIELFCLTHQPNPLPEKSQFCTGGNE
jgi:hypothetical protein